GAWLLMVSPLRAEGTRALWSADASRAARVDPSRCVRGPLASSPRRRTVRASVLPSAGRGGLHHGAVRAGARMRASTGCRRLLHPVSRPDAVWGDAGPPP